MWIGERINEKGLGNGISLLIFAGIISRVGPMIVNTLAGIINGTESVLTALIVAVVSLAMIVAVVYVDQGERRVPVQYAKRMVGRKMYGGQSTHIPMRVNVRRAAADIRLGDNAVPQHDTCDSTDILGCAHMVGHSLLLRVLGLSADIRAADNRVYVLL